MFWHCSSNSIKGRCTMSRVFAAYKTFDRHSYPVSLSCCNGAGSIWQPKEAKTESISILPSDVSVDPVINRSILVELTHLLQGHPLALRAAKAPATTAELLQKTTWGMYTAIS
jgi:hypothetical protein